MSSPQTVIWKIEEFSEEDFEPQPRIDDTDMSEADERMDDKLKN